MINRQSNYLIFSLILLALCYLSDFPLWNDGSHFLMRMLEYGYFIDPLWERYSDVIFQIIPKALQKQHQSISTIKYIFKIGLVLIPFGSLLYRIRYLENKGDYRPIQFIYFNLVIVFSLSIFFPATTSLLSSILGLLLLSLFLQKQFYQNDFLLFFILQTGILIGHESVFIALIFPFFCIKFFSNIKFTKIERFQIITSTVLVLLIMLYTRAPIWIKNMNYLKGQKNITSILDFSVIFIWVLAIPCFELFKNYISKKKYLIISTISILIIYFLIYQLELLNWYRIFFNIRNLFFIFCLGYFLIAQKFELKLTKKLIATYLLFTALLIGKVIWYWEKSNSVFNKFSNQRGCFYISKSEFSKFSPPEWTYPFISILNQNTFQPTHIIFSKELANGSEYCYRAGVTLITPFKMDNYIQFNTNFKSEELIASIPLLKWNTNSNFLGAGIVLNNGDDFIIENDQDSCLKITGSVPGENKKIRISQGNKLILELSINNEFQEIFKLPKGVYNISSKIEEKYYFLLIKNFEKINNCKN